ncbi:DNA2/NAM7 family helicase [Streptomyces oceani]|uniref:DNA2/NAM7 family helicase n=1 Tax=Streptomyces oceani TaxID=1075402 RepID=UPI000871BEF7|nr:DNA2/NAM7 family helicase [Streptomyces oceani]
MWWHVAGTEAREHWVPGEGRVLADGVARLRAQGLPEDELFVLIPFRMVSAEAAKVLRGTVPGERIGTVHTAQGKESDVVILVLGTARQAVGSRAWASQSANLLNVAVSRGQTPAHRDWRPRVPERTPFFSTLSEELPRHAAGEPSPSATWRGVDHVR